MNDAPNNPNKFGPWPLGLNTLSAPHALPRGALHEAYDVEVDNQGYLTPAGYKSAPPLFPNTGDSMFSFGSRFYTVKRDAGLIKYTMPFETGETLGEEERIYNVLDIGSYIAMFVPLKYGIWVATDTETYWYSGKDALTMQQECTLPVGALRGTGLRTPEGSAIWTSPLGVMVGDDGGNTKVITGAALSPSLFTAQTASDKLYRDATGNLKYAVTPGI